MALAVRAAARAAAGICALWGLLALSACEGALGTSPPDAAPANPSAEAGDGEAELRWGAGTDATRYVILWGNDPDVATYDNDITGIEDTSHTHEALHNPRNYRHQIAAE